MNSLPNQPSTNDKTSIFENMVISLDAGPRFPKGLTSETRKVVEIAQKFNEDVIRPGSLELDRKMAEDPGYLPLDFIKTANEWGLFTMWIPKVFGGQGYNFSTMAPFLEEIGSSCLSMANLVGVHYVGAAVLSAALNASMMNKLFRETVEGEKNGVPCVFSTAVTEPDAGTDVEEIELTERGNITCHAKKVEGGYVLNGTKVFISNGHFATWHMVIAYSDLNRPAETAVVMAVKTGMKGFSFGRMEKKMGQKACPASELIFKDCFVPDEYVCLDSTSKYWTDKSYKDVIKIMIEDILTLTRAGVGAFGSGAAKGAMEHCLKFSNETKVNGKLLINHEWAQSMLAEMYKNLAIAKYTYFEALYANGLYGMVAPLQLKPVYYFLKHTPKVVLNRIGGWLMGKPFITRLIRSLRLYSYKKTHGERSAGLASLAKFACTDAGIQNAHMAVALMGQAGLRHDKYAEKFLRDAKLLQIYEGTNQLNRLNLFKCLISEHYPKSVVFDD